MRSKQEQTLSRGRGGPKIRYAVVGLGHIAQSAIIPAFAHAENSELVGLVSDDREKLEQLAKIYGVRHIASYDGYDELLRSGAVDAVYIALPNHLHREYTERAARAGVHVLCEKPMAVTEEDCQKMLWTCTQAGVKLMIAYRLHFEPANMEVVELVQSGDLGDVRFFTSTFAVPVKEGDTRLKRETGGGTLYDIGIYCINAARYLFADEPYEVLASSARGLDPKFEVDETTSAVLRFPGDRVATFTVSFGTEAISQYVVGGTKGLLRVAPAYEFDTALGFERVGNGDARKHTFGPHDQFAPELIYFSRCIQKDLDPEPDGLEGLADVRIIQALYRSAETRQAVEVKPVEKLTRPGRALEMKLPPVEDAPLVKTSSPHG